MRDGLDSAYVPRGPCHPCRPRPPRGARAGGHPGRPPGDPAFRPRQGRRERSRRRCRHGFDFRHIFRTSPYAPGRHSAARAGRYLLQRR